MKKLLTITIAIMLMMPGEASALRPMAHANRLQADREFTRAKHLFRDYELTFTGMSIKIQQQFLWMLSDYCGYDDPGALLISDFSKEIPELGRTMLAFVESSKETRARASDRLKRKLGFTPRLLNFREALDKLKKPGSRLKWDCVSKNAKITFLVELAHALGKEPIYLVTSDFDAELEIFGGKDLSGLRDNVRNKLIKAAKAKGEDPGKITYRDAVKELKRQLGFRVREDLKYWLEIFKTSDIKWQYVPIPIRTMFCEILAASQGIAAKDLEPGHFEHRRPEVFNRKSLASLFDYYKSKREAREARIKFIKKRLLLLQEEGPEELYAAAGTLLTDANDIRALSVLLKALKPRRVGYESAVRNLYILSNIRKAAPGMRLGRTKTLPRALKRISAFLKYDGLLGYGLRCVAQDISEILTSKIKADGEAAKKGEGNGSLKLLLQKMLALRNGQVTAITDLIEAKYRALKGEEYMLFARFFSVLGTSVKYLRGETDSIQALTVALTDWRALQEYSRKHPSSDVVCITEAVAECVGPFIEEIKLEYLGTMLECPWETEEDSGGEDGDEAKDKDKAKYEDELYSGLARKGISALVLPEWEARPFNNLVMEAIEGAA